MNWYYAIMKQIFEEANIHNAVVMVEKRHKTFYLVSIPWWHFGSSVLFYANVLCKNVSFYCKEYDHFSHLSTVYTNVISIIN